MSKLVDNRNTEIAVGQEVAYNMSGEVVKGVIHSISPGGFRVKPTIKITLSHPAVGKSAGHLSTVRSSRNLLVLQVNGA
jgi:hypothetical protein